ncbi:hypothetical protein OS493_025688 [Desmophyllum pertusum]|uniref:Uncharacterized protein n=1 Tax=Desmophyllum pertusum TaxID=174260 RepID=A0A9X0D243_9CNID|nr:hypothetical protein OS493_025688 [Desmophyllum pertusum]
MSTAKRMKKEPGGVTGKSVVVLRSSDVTRRNVYVFMPNTIEMAQLKKPGKGQFKTNVEISSNMTEMDIKMKLVEIFPILKQKRFYCAAAVDNRSRLEFHGEPCIWNGHNIKRRIKGNSALYILAEEEQQRRNIVRGLEQSTLKRSHDEVTTNERSDSSASDIVPVEMPFSHAVFPGSGQQATVFSVPSNPPKNITGYPIVVSGQARTVEKHDKQDVLDLLPMQSRPNVSTIQSKSTARDVATMTASSLPQSLPMDPGAFMVPAGGIVVAKPGPMGDKAISTASEQPRVFHVVKGPDARQPGLPLAPQVMMSSMLTPQMNNLNISSATSASRDRDAQTAETTETSQQAPTITTMGQSKKSYPENKTTTDLIELQEVVRFKSANQSRQSLDENMISSQTVTDESLFGSDVQCTDDSEHERSSTASEVDRNPRVPVTANSSSDTGFDGSVDFSDDPSSYYAPGDFGDLFLANDQLWETEQDDPSVIATHCQISSCFRTTFVCEDPDLVTDSELPELLFNTDNDVDLLADNPLILQPDNASKPDGKRVQSKSGQPWTMRSPFKSMTEQKKQIAVPCRKISP